MGVFHVDIVSAEESIYSGPLSFWSRRQRRERWVFIRNIPPC